MIAGAGWDATFARKYRDSSGKERTLYEQRPVVYFDDAGEGWIASLSGDGGLRRASGYGNFVGYEDAGTPVAMLPADGWYWRQPDGVERWPVVAWVLYSDGDIRGVDVTSEGAQISGRGIRSTIKHAMFEPEDGWPDEGEAVTQAAS